MSLPPDSILAVPLSSSPMPLAAAKSYCLAGAAFGLTFPIIGTAIVCHQQFGHVDIAGIVQAQSTNPLLWIINTAPLFLGLFATFAGARQDKITAINLTLAERVREQTAHLQTANASLQREIEVRTAREGELVEAYEEAAASTRAKDRFVSNISHELRTPLNGIIGMADELLHANPTDAQRDSLKMLSYSAHNLLAIINDMLDLAKASADKLELAPQPFRPAELLQSVEAAVRTKVESKNLHFETRLIDPLPAILIGDSVRLYQILLNLVGNAVKFTDEGSVTVEIRTPVRTPTSCDIEVHVRDTGIGIPLEHQDRIFDDFAQAHSKIASKYGGTGLGLAITRKLVELHGSVLQFESTPGSGSVFHFSITLPIAAMEAETATITPSDSPSQDLGFAPSDSAPAQTMQLDLTVLLVEDHPVNQVVATTFLKRIGITPDLAKNGREAVRMAEARDYDIILMDIQLPEMDGLEATRRIRASAVAHARNARIVALTASALREEVQYCVDAGMDAFLSKPFRPHELQQTIVDVMSRRVSHA